MEAAMEWLNKNHPKVGRLVGSELGLRAQSRAAAPEMISVSSVVIWA